MPEVVHERTGDLIASPATDATAVSADYVVGVDASSLPEEVVRQARIVLADTIGVLCSASRGAPVHAALLALAPESGTCTVVGHDRRANPEAAALINGIGGHDIELDDLHSASRTHPASVIVPAALAAAELQQGSSFGDLLAGIVAGYDVQTRLSKALGPISQYERGFHPSAVTGVVGAAVAAGRVFAIPTDAMVYCFGLAASQCSGLLTYYDDSFHMAKSFQTGIAARGGITAALFARAGYTSAPDALTGRNSMLKPFGGPQANAHELVDELGSRYEILSTTLKRHACCALSHSAVDALLSIIEDPTITPETIERIDVQLPHAAIVSVDRNPLWTHNIQYTLALTAHEGRVALEHFSPRWTSDPGIRELAARISVSGSDALQERFPEQNGAIVTVFTRENSTSRRCDAPRGSPSHPFTTQELSEKFLLLARPVMQADTAHELWDRIMTAPVDSSPEAVLRPLTEHARTGSSESA